MDSLCAFPSGAWEGGVKIVYKLEFKFCNLYINKYEE
jgi:hypothetical protein